MSAKVAKPSQSGASKAPPSAKDVASLQVSLSEMLDLALGTPEVGAINLNILHNFLHILLHQINLRSTKVEYRGDDANRIRTMVTSLKAGPSLYLHEYNVTDGSNSKQRVKGSDTINVKVDVVVTDEPVTETTDENTEKHSKPTSAPTTVRERSESEKAAGSMQDASMRKSKGGKQQIGPGIEGEYETVIYVEPIVDGAAPTALGFKRLEQTINDLQRRFQALEELPKNPELIERLKGKITDPLTDVWQIINITKRLDASEQCIDKLTTMVQDALKSDKNIMEEQDTPQFEERITNLENVLTNLDETVKNLQIISNVMENDEVVPSAAEDDAVQPGQRVSLSQLLGGVDVKEMHEDVATLKKEVSKMRADLKGLTERASKSTSVRHAETTPARQSAGNQETGQKEQKKDESEQQKEAETLQEDKAVEPEGTAEKEKTKQKQKETANPKSARSESLKSPKKADVEVKDTIDPKALTVINERLTKLENSVWSLLEKADDVQTTGTDGNAELNELVSKIQGIQSEMDKLNQTADRLIDDRENREVHLNALLEQVELLKTIKADREDLEDALAEKADAQTIQRKVSYDQFDAACDDLAQGLEDAIGKLGKQETVWQQALDEVQREIEGKVDKIEMTPLKDFVSNRLKTLQEKIKTVADTRQESEAAGSKKMLKDVECISCGKNVVMKMEDTRKFKVEPLPCSISMKPYLTYELDQVRKQHRRLPHSRNMIQFEAALQEESKKQKSARLDTLVKTPRDHLFNRYCGGSHTVTTPQQRVTRVDNFLTQWGPEVVQLTEGIIKGIDGRMYKSRPMPGKFDTCGPAYCDEHREEFRPSEQPPPQSRKVSQKQGSISSRRRSSKRQSKQSVEEVIEEMIDAHIEIEKRDSDILPYDTGTHNDQVIHYDENEEIDEND